MFWFCYFGVVGFCDPDFQGFGGWHWCFIVWLELSVLWGWYNVMVWVLGVWL